MQFIPQSPLGRVIGCDLCNFTTARSASSCAPEQQVKLLIFANNSSCVIVLSHFLHVINNLIKSINSSIKAVN